MKKKFSLETEEYDVYTEGKPYIGIVDPGTGQVARWGNWIGTSGDPGLLEIVGEEGSVIVAGQKGNSSRKTWKCFYYVQDDLTLQKMGRADAIKAARARRQQKLAQPLATYAELFCLLDAKTLPEAIERIKQLKALEVEATAKNDTQKPEEAETANA